MDLFDFSSYLTSVLSVPPQEIDIQPLTGGLMNLTIRASFTPPANLFQFGYLSSVVLKYAPPFIAAYPTQPMSVNRQVIEATALVLLSGRSMPAISEVLSKFPTLRIPKLIHHDAERHVLWMTDLGETRTLSQYLTSDPPLHDIQRIAISLGAFLAELFIATGDPSDDIISLVAKPSHIAETYSFVISVTKKVLTTAGIANAELLAERVNQALQSNGTVEPCLGMADLWPGNILIDSHCNVGLVDWEYFGLSTASSELGMLVAHLHLIRLQTQASAHDNSRLFTASLLDSYFKHAAVPSGYFKRQTLIAYGCELVTRLENARELEDASKCRLLKAGVRSLIAAGGSEEEVDYSMLKVLEDDCGTLSQDIMAMVCHSTLLPLNEAELQE